MNTVKLFSESVEEVEYITEAKEDGSKSYKIRGIFMQADIKNRNGRVYPMEILENEVGKYNKNFKILCIGGGLGIDAGEISKCPEILQNFGLEFVWRLNSDPWRRIKRLTGTIFIYILNLHKINKKIKIINF